MILIRQNMSENNWNHFKIVPQGHNNCQLSIVNCQFGEAAKFQFIGQLRKPKITVSYISYLISYISYCPAGDYRRLYCTVVTVSSSRRMVSFSSPRVTTQALPENAP